MKRCNRRERLRSKIRSMLPTPASLVTAGPKVTRTAVRDRVRQLFTPALVHQVLASAKGEYRQRLLTIEVVVLAMLEFVLWQWTRSSRSLTTCGWGRCQGCRRWR